MKKARIYQPVKNAMQSAPMEKHWLLEFERDAAHFINPLMGWIGSLDTSEQIAINFPTREAAVEYAQKHGLAFEVISPNPKVKKPKSYAANFSFNRIRSFDSQ